MKLFVFGSNTFLASQKLKEIRLRFIDRFDKSAINIIDFCYDKSSKVDDFSILVSSPPFLSERRLVILRNLLSSLTKKDSKKWVEVLSSINNDHILVFYDDCSQKEFLKKELAKQFSQGPDVFLYPFEDFSTSQLFAWISNEAREHQLICDHRIITELSYRLGNDPWLIHQEVTKLSDYCLGRACVMQDLESILRHSFDDSMFPFLDALTAKDTKKAFTLLEEQRKHDADDYFLWVMLMRQIKLLLGMTDYLEKNPRAGSQEIAGALAIPPFVVQKTLPFVKKFDRSKLFLLYQRIFTYDHLLKRSKILPHILVEKIVFDILKA
ncbi:MAG: DNA polymerase III subunit delta [Patescibacteria group bacterium]|jgi:DNA polymerase III delta subunit